MAKYISLINWTDQGIRNAKETVNRSNVARKAFQDAGGQLIDVYWTLGQYDIIVIFDVPDDETAFRVMLNLGKQGNIRTSTMKAIGEQDMTKILQGIA
jgi:uncharacterized protein with GYD domain